MQITFDTNNLSELDVKILDIVLAELTEEPEAAPVAPEPKPAAKKTAKAAAPAPEPEPEPEEDLLGDSGEPEAPAPTMSDAVAAATALVSGGNAAAVKSALADLDVKRVSELADDQIAKFLAALPTA